MKQNTLVDQNETIIVAFDKFNDSSIDVLISCFVKTTSRSVLLEAKEDILLDAYAFLRELGGDIAFPTRTLDIPAGLLTKS
jgi:MscS family membrane protein